MRKKSKLFQAAIKALWTWRRSMHKITTCTQLYSDIILFMLNMTSEISLRKFKPSRIWWARICNVWSLQVKRLCCFWDKKIFLSKLPLKLSKTCDRFVGKWNAWFWLPGHKHKHVLLLTRISICMQAFQKNVTAWRLSSVLSWILQCGHSTSSCTCILILQFHCVITVLQLPEYCIHNSKHCTQIISTFQAIPTITCTLCWTISTPHIRHCTDVYSHLGFRGDALACPIQWLKFPVLVYCFIPITKKIYCYEFSADQIQVSANRMIRQVWRTIILQYHTLQKYSSSQANCWCCWLQLIPNTSAHTHLLNPEFFITILNFDANSWDYKGIPSTLFLTLGWVPGSCYPSTKNAWIETIKGHNHLHSDY